MKAALVIMAAGMGSRYGGSKQVDGIGPDGEILMEYSIYDAIRAGFTKVVFIIKPEMRELVETLCGRRVAGMTAVDGSPVEVCYAYQDFSSVPDFYTVPSDRVKPFGTVHALLCAREFVHEPFVVINADDYYGVDAFKTIYAELSKLAESGEGTMVGYDLCNTVSEHGTVTRGVCHVNEQGMLDRVVETFHLKPCDDGKFRDIQENGDGPVYAPETPVSMNFWGFTPAIFGEIERRFPDFLAEGLRENPQAEMLVPNLVGRLLREGLCSVDVMRSGDMWYGMTYREDKPGVVEAVRRLTEAGLYPASLWK